MVCGAVAVFGRLRESAREVDHEFGVGEGSHKYTDRPRESVVSELIDDSLVNK